MIKILSKIVHNIPRKYIVPRHSMISSSSKFDYIKVFEENGKTIVEIDREYAKNFNTQRVRQDNLSKFNNKSIWICGKV
jgi:hypothetical protein